MRGTLAGGSLPVSPVLGRSPRQVSLGGDRDVDHPSGAGEEVLSEVAGFGLT